MPRTLSALLTSEIAKSATQPFYLIYIGFATPSRLSTGATVSYDGNSWIGGSARVERLASTPGGGLEADISVSNTDDAIGAAVLGADLSGTAVTIAALYGAGPYAAGSAEQLFSGEIDSAELSVTRVSLGLVSSGRRNLTGPRLYCQPPICNHMPPPGTLITFLGETFVLNATEPYLTADGGVSRINAMLGVGPGAYKRRQREYAPYFRLSEWPQWLTDLYTKPF